MSSRQRKPTLTAMQQRGELSPLQYLVDLVNDPTADPARRDRAAIAAAPYLHPRPMATGKKAAQAEAARNVGGDDVWGDDLIIDHINRRQ
jgi:hypothetical protein